MTIATKKEETIVPLNNYMKLNSEDTFTNKKNHRYQFI